MQMPKDGKIYSINEGQYLKFPQGVKKYIKYCQEEDKATNRPYASRYIGSLVADFHRNLLKGGIYIYPSATKMCIRDRYIHGQNSKTCPYTNKE